MQVIVLRYFLHSKFPIRENFLWNLIFDLRINCTASQPIFIMKPLGGSNPQIYSSFHRFFKFFWLENYYRKFGSWELLGKTFRTCLVSLHMQGN